jgi:hypothetical protein
MIRHLVALKLLGALIVLVSGGTLASAESVPLPRPRPAQAATVQPPDDEPPADEVAQPSACRVRLTTDLAIAPSVASIAGPGECGAVDLVRLEAVVLPDKSRVAFTPSATLRCTMAEAIANWVREEAVPLAQDLGDVLRTIQNFDSYDCRGRNRVVGAKISEHGKGNAMDMRGLRLGNGKFFEFTDPHVSRDFREAVRKSVCGRFTTVLGPGSDGYHETHIHVDLAERRGGYRICQWDVRDPKPAAETVAATTAIPLPPPRPKIEDKGTAGRKL